MTTPFLTTITAGTTFCRIFISFQWVLIFIQFLVQEIVPDEPEEYTVQLKRMAFIRSKVIDHTPDEAYDLEADEEEEGGGAEETTRQSVFASANGGINPLGFLPCCRVHRGKNLRKKINEDNLQEVTVQQYPQEVGAVSTGALRAGGTVSASYNTNPMQKDLAAAAAVEQEP